MMNFILKFQSQVLILFALALSLRLSAQNPIVRHMYTADPSAHVFNGRLYVYPSHDRDSGVTFDMVDYHVFSTDNMVDWTDHGLALSLHDVSWAGGNAWAPDCNYSNGRYYFYFPTDRSYIGVAVGDSPAGPFRDALGKPLVRKDSPGVVNKRDFIDPSIFIDDDGAPYLFFGQLDLNVVRLNEDMVSYEGPVHIIEGAKNFFEAAWVHKYNGTYYLSYSTWGEKGVTGPQIVYATSDNVLGPYHYQGVILDEVNSGTNHHSIVEFRGNWYLFYHTSDLFLGRTRPDSPEFKYRPYRRSVCVDRLYNNDDGSIQKVLPSFRGVGLTPAGSRIQVDRYSSISGEGVSLSPADLGSQADLGAQVDAGTPADPIAPSALSAQTDSGAQARGWKIIFQGKGARSRYDRVDFGTEEYTSVEICASVQQAGTLEIRLDYPEGPVLATADLDKTEGITSFCIRLTDFPAGTRDLYFRLKDTGRIEVDWISFH